MSVLALSLYAALDCVPALIGGLEGQCSGLPETDKHPQRRMLRLCTCQSAVRYAAAVMDSLSLQTGFFAVRDHACNQRVVCFFLKFCARTGVHRQSISC
jgi:hypothetical protein